MARSLILAAAAKAGELVGRVEGVVNGSQRNRGCEVTRKATGAGLGAIWRPASAVAWRTFRLIGIAIVVFAVFVVTAIWISKFTYPWDRIAPNAFVAKIVRQLLRLAIIALGIVVALDIVGATAVLGTILGAAGIAGLALGFAIRDTVENYVASIMLSVRQPFRPNDHVSINEHEGYVIRLTSRATVLLTLDGNHVRIPNAIVFKGVIVNYSRNPDRRFEFTLGVDSESDLKQALEIGIERMAGLDFILSDPDPSGRIGEVGDSNVVLRFSGWVDQGETDFLDARSEAIRHTKLALERSGFSLPEPIYRLRIEDAGILFGKSSHADKPSVAPKKDVAETTVADVSRDKTITQKIAHERAVTDKDLLDPTVPNELG